ncbi:uncharacterized protein WCC33_000503 [Rhinophrynus dorsalis]
MPPRRKKQKVDVPNSIPSVSENSGGPVENRKPIPPIDTVRDNVVLPCGTTILQEDKDFIKIRRKTYLIDKDDAPALKSEPWVASLVQEVGFGRIMENDRRLTYVINPKCNLNEETGNQLHDCDPGTEMRSSEREITGMKIQETENLVQLDARHSKKGRKKKQVSVLMLNSSESLEGKEKESGKKENNVQILKASDEGKTKKRSKKMGGNQNQLPDSAVEEETGQEENIADLISIKETNNGKTMVVKDGESEKNPDKATTSATQKKPTKRGRKKKTKIP